MVVECGSSFSPTSCAAWRVIFLSLHNTVKKKPSENLVKLNLSVKNIFG